MVVEKETEDEVIQQAGHLSPSPCGQLGRPCSWGPRQHWASARGAAVWSGHKGTPRHPGPGCSPWRARTLAAGYIGWRTRRWPAPHCWRSWGRSWGASTPHGPGGRLINLLGYVFMVPQVLWKGQGDLYNGLVQQLSSSFLLFPLLLRSTFKSNAYMSKNK